MKRVLSIVLNNFKYDARVLKECHTLQKKGYLIQVVALHEDDLPEKETMQEIPVHRIRLKTKKWPKNSLFNICKYIEFSFKVIKNYCGKIDIVHCNDIDPLLTSVLLKWLTGSRIKLVYDAHEYETETVGLNGFKKTITKWVEKLLIHHVDAVITVSQGIADEYVRLYKIPPPSLVMNCPNYVDVPKKNRFREYFGISEKQTIFLYQGRLSEGRGIEIMIEAFQKIKHDDVVLVIMGFGPLQTYVEENIHNATNIFYHHAVSNNEILEFTASADLGIIFTQNVCLNHYFCLPNKFFEYAMAGLPVISNDLAEIGKIIKTFQCGVIMKEESVSGMVEAINNIMSLNLKTYSLNAKGLARKYNWEEQESSLLNVYKEL